MSAFGDATADTAKLSLTKLFLDIKELNELNSKQYSQTFWSLGGVVLSRSTAMIYSVINYHCDIQLYRANFDIMKTNDESDDVTTLLQNVFLRVWEFDQMVTSK